MIWFIFGCILGFDAFRLRGSGWRWAPISVIVLIGLGYVGWMISVERGNSLAGIVEDIGQGPLARFLLGLVLGIGIAFTIWRAPAGTRPSLITGLGILLVLGLIAPHLDRWFKQLTGFKSSFVEVQLSSATSAHHAVAVAELAVEASNTGALEGLGKYDQEIRQDIDFIRYFEIPDLKYKLGKSPGYVSETQEKLNKAKDRLKDAELLLPVFEELLSPTAECVQNAIKKAGLNIEGVRFHVRPIATLLQAILFNEDKPALTKLVDKQRDDFWQHIMQLPEDENIKPFLQGSEVSRESGRANERKKETKRCLQYSKDYANNRKPFPKIKDYPDMPYLYGAAAFFLSFMRYNDASATLLRRVKPKFMDYVFLNNAGKLSYYVGVSAELSVPFYETMRDAARAHQVTINAVEARCKVGRCDQKDLVLKLATELKQRERKAELRAMNNFTYIVAEDLARGVKSAEAFRATAEDHAEAIRIAAEKGEYGAEGKDSLLDTYAYMALVAESRKATPDRQRFKSLISLLEKILENYERRVNEDLRDEKPIAAIDFTSVRIARAHLAAAHDLAGE